MKSNLGNRNYLKFRKFFLLGLIENAFLTFIYLSNGASPDPPTWMFLSTNLRFILRSPLQSPKNQGLTSFPFGENEDFEKKFLLRQYIVSTLFLELLINGNSFSPQIFNMIFGAKYFQTRFFANVPGAHAAVSILASLTHEEPHLYAKCSHLELTFIRSPLKIKLYVIII